MSRCLLLLYGLAASLTYLEISDLIRSRGKLPRFNAQIYTNNTQGGGDELSRDVSKHAALEASMK